jgi:hypothetical protein
VIGKLTVTASDHLNHLALSTISTFEFHSVNVECFGRIGSAESASFLSIDSAGADIDSGTTTLAEGKVGCSAEQVSHWNARAVSWLHITFELLVNNS